MARMTLPPGMAMPEVLAALRAGGGDLPVDGEGPPNVGVALEDIPGRHHVRPSRGPSPTSTHISPGLRMDLAATSASSRSKPTHTATPIFWTGPKDSDQSSPLALRAPAVTAPA